MSSLYLHFTNTAHLQNILSTKTIQKPKEQKVIGKTYANHRSSSKTIKGIYMILK